MRRRTLLGAAAAAALVGGGVRASGAQSGFADAEDAVDVLLVLAVDVSRSVTEEEGRLQRQGYYAALTDPQVVETIRGGMLGAIGVAYIEWSGVEWQRLIEPWTRIGSAQDAEAWCASVDKKPPQAVGWTSISGAIDFSRKVLSEAPWDAMRKVVDISGDGVNNSGRPAEQARDEAVAEGIVINGLPILKAQVMAGGPPLTEYYQKNVVGGPGAFVVPAADFHAFAQAVKRKIIMEVAGRHVPGGVLHG
jgi:hypothetical protein